MKWNYLDGVTVKLTWNEALRVFGSKTPFRERRMLFLVSHVLLKTSPRYCWEPFHVFPKHLGEQAIPSSCRAQVFENQAPNYRQPFQVCLWLMPSGRETASLLGYQRQKNPESVSTNLPLTIYTADLCDRHAQEQGALQSTGSRLLFLTAWWGLGVAGIVFCYWERNLELNSWWHTCRHHSPL